MTRHLKRHLPLVILTITLNAIAYALLAGQAIFQQILLDLAFDGEMRQFFEILLYGAIFMVAVITVFYLAEISKEKFQKAFKKSIRDDLFRGILKRSKEPNFQAHIPYYASILYAHVHNLGNMYKTAIGNIWGAFVGSVVALVIMLVSSLPLAALVVGVNLVAVFLPKAYDKTIKNRREQETQSQGDFTEEVIDMLEKAAHEAKDPFVLLDDFKDRFEKTNNSYAKAEYKHGKVLSWVWSFPQTLTIFRNLIVAFVVVLMILNDNATIGTLALFISLNASFYQGVSVMVSTLPSYKKGMGSIMKQIGEIVDGGAE